MEDKIVMIPLIAKEQDDIKFMKVIKLLIGLLILTNIAWSSTWLVHSLHDHDLIITEKTEVENECEREEERDDDNITLSEGGVVWSIRGKLQKIS